MAERTALSMLLFFGFAANIYFVSPSIAGIPLRFIYMLFLLLALFTASSAQCLRAISLIRNVLLIIFYLAAVGFALSAVRGEASAAGSELVATHAQAVVVLLVTTTATLILGPRPVIWAFAGAVGLSYAFSILQWIGVEPAVTVRDFLGMVHVRVDDAAESADRAPGLSYDTIYLVQQCCLVFTGVLFLKSRIMEGQRHKVRGIAVAFRRWRATAIWIVAILAICVVSGNRSPILGLAVFLSLAYSARNPRLLFLTVPLFVGFYFLIDPLRDLMAGTGLRVGQTDDKSALARSPLWTYGIRLFMANPLGYGLAFDSKTLTNTVETGDLIASLNSGQMLNLLYDEPIHNYYINIFDIYGIFLLPVALYCLNIIRKNWEISLPFTPYLVHIFFHNSGPLLGDYLFWVPVGILVGGTFFNAHQKIKRQQDNM